MLRSFFLAAIVTASIDVLSSGGAAAQGMPCANEIMPLREAIQKQGLTVKAAIDRKAPPAELCTQLKSMTTVEEKFVKYLTDNQTWCGVPPDAIQQVTASHEHTTKIRNQVCKVAASGGGPQGPAIPRGPGLSDALGTSRAPTPGNAKTGHGTFDTLTGNPFKQ